MGLDPNAVVDMSQVLGQIARRLQPRVVVSLRPEDEVPTWVSHSIIVDEYCRVVAQGSRKDTTHLASEHVSIASATAATQVSRDGYSRHLRSLAKALRDGAR